MQEVTGSIPVSPTITRPLEISPGAFWLYRLGDLCAIALGPRCGAIPVSPTIIKKMGLCAWGPFFTGQRELVNLSTRDIRGSVISVLTDHVSLQLVEDVR
jgi:hypothetical protein